MSSETQLFHDFPELAHLSREDLEDLLSDQSYFQAVFHSLPRVKAMYQAQSELGMANEAISSALIILLSRVDTDYSSENNLALQDSLYHLRAETKDAFDEAKALEARWKELEKEQKDVYQRFTPQFLLMRLRHATIAQDEASEALATAFVQQQPPPPPSAASSGTGTPSGRDIDDFVKEFKDLRKTYHKRVIWSDRWNSGQVTWRDD
ncbi:hypothetical protein CPB85DRAFT_464483 [Mucidula mucida]|nr:hypothetical protein CPB85DRAFT_464483 [Mucidula mucida]